MTSKEFSSAVELEFRKIMAVVTQSDIDDYVNGEEFRDEIATRYNRGKNGLLNRSSTMTESAYWRSVVVSTANCLALCF